MKLMTCVLLLTFLAAKPASAQQCLGSPSFRVAPYQVAVAASFTDGVREVEGTFAGGGESLFAGAGASVVKFTDADLTTAGISAFAGAEFATDQRSRVLLCPVVGLSFLAGPDLGPIDVSSAAVQGGASIGVIASENADLMVVPFFGLFALYQRVTTEIGSTENSVSDTGAVADLGVGLIFNRTVAITPLVSIPFAAGSSDAIFTIRFSFNFGG